jgi:hypothetical protein
VIHSLLITNKIRCEHHIAYKSFKCLWLNILSERTFSSVSVPRISHLTNKINYVQIPVQHFSRYLQPPSILCCIFSSFGAHVTLHYTNTHTHTHTHTRTHARETTSRHAILRAFYLLKVAAPYLNINYLHLTVTLIEFSISVLHWNWSHCRYLPLTFCACVMCI